MTIIESSDALLTWFKENNSFNIKDDFKKLFPNYISETPEADEVSIICALKTLEENNIIKSDKVNGSSYYVLVRPLDMIEQNVSIGYNTVFILSNILRQTAESTGNNKIILDPMNVSEKDILLALSILMEAAKVNIDSIQEKMNQE